MSHSRGGLVADLLCLGDFDAQIDSFGRPANMPGSGDADPDSAEAKRLAEQLDAAYAEHRACCASWRPLLRDKQFVVQRYVRAASPANGTRLASGNFDLFLSGLLTLIGQVPFFFGSPFYCRLQARGDRDRQEPHQRAPGARHRGDAARFADRAACCATRRCARAWPMAVIAGDIEGGNLLVRLGVLLTDFLLFDATTTTWSSTPPRCWPASRRGPARACCSTAAPMSRTSATSPTSDTRSALRDWLVDAEPGAARRVPAAARPEPRMPRRWRAAARDAWRSTDRPVVVILPGVMGSHLQVGGKDRVWFDPLDIAAGGLAKIAWGKPGVEAEDLFGMFYGDLCERPVRQPSRRAASPTTGASRWTYWASGWASSSTG